MADYDGDKNILGLQVASPISSDDQMIIGQQADDGKAKYIEMETLSEYLKGTVSFDFSGALDLCEAATSATLSATYNNAAGTLTATSSGAFSLTDYTGVLSDRIVVRSQTNAYENGIYTITTLGDGATAYVLTRATDADTFTEFSQYTVAVTDGAFNGYTFWFNTATTGVIGTDDIDISVFIAGTNTHNQLEGLNVADYQHLTAAQLSTLTSGAGSDASALHGHPDYLDTDEEITGGRVMRDLGSIAGTDRYVALQLPTAAGSRMNSITQIECLIYGQTGAGYDTMIEPINLSISVNRSSSSLAVVTANYTGDAESIPILLYDAYAAADVVYVDLNAFNSYKFAVKKLITYNTLATYTSFAISTTGTLSGALSDSYTAYEHMKQSEGIDIDIVAYSGTVDVDVSNLREKIITMQISGAVAFEILNPVQGGVYQLVIRKSSSSDMTLSHSQVENIVFVTSGTGYSIASTDIVFSGDVLNAWIVTYKYIGNYFYASIEK